MGNHSHAGDLLPELAWNSSAQGAATAAAESTPLWPLAVFAALALTLIALMLVLTTVLGPRHRARRRDLPYESGMPATGGVNVRFPVRFYLIAIAFLVFDLEAAYLFGWAVAAREAGWAGYVEAMVFMLILFAGLVYLWGKGAFDWGRRPAAPSAPAGR